MGTPFHSQKLLEDIQAILTLFGASPTLALRKIERQLPLLAPGPNQVTAYLENRSIKETALGSAQNMRANLGQLDVITHALGILLSLPGLLDDDEQLVELSLGAGNTGKGFDLVTDKRIAEFKLIEWKGGPESIRQNSVFQDFLKLLWDESGKRKQLYLNGTEIALKFFKGGRALSSVLSRNNRLMQGFNGRYGSEFRTVGEFFVKYQNSVEIIDLRDMIPTLARTA